MLQSRFMYENKVRNDFIGYWACFVHCVMYSACVVAWMHAGRPLASIDFHQAFLMFGLVYITHYPIDKWSLGHWWLRGLGRKDTPLMLTRPNTHASDMSFLHKVFYWLVYVVVDNTMHLVLMTVGFMLYFPDFVGIS